MRRCLASILAALALGVAGPVVAQDWAGPLSPSVFPSWVGQDPIGMALDAPSAPAAPSRPAGSASAPSDAQAPVSMRYRPSPARRAAGLTAFVDKVRPRDPASAAQLEALFASGRFFDSIDQSLAGYGLRSDDVADAFTVWWVNVWQAGHGQKSDLSPRTAAAVRRQAAAAMSAVPAFAQADDARRQELAETLLLQAVLFDAAMDQANADPAQWPGVRRLAAQNAGAMGLNLRSMTLTETGFVFD